MKKKINSGVWCIYNKERISRNLCSNCEHREYKDNNVSIKKVTRSNKTIHRKKHKLTKATDIPKEVKLKVWERDNHRCIFCGKQVPWNYANSHYIKRSQLGLGIEENIMTNCERCHKLYDDSIYRNDMMKYAKNYFINLYPGWNEDKLAYKKNRI